MCRELKEDVLDKLYELLAQDQFELLTPFDTGKIRLVYLMNDAAESFLVFENAKMTGFYDVTYEGELEAELRREEDGRYVLMVRRGGMVCTLFFHDLSLEVHLYNYGTTGHVWVQGHEELRQIEYWIAIMRAKQEFLGDSYCNDEERKLIPLEEFPPLNVCSYPAVPEQYYEPREDAWVPTLQGIQAMQSMAEEAGDLKLMRVLEHYKVNHGKRETRRIAALLCRNRHSKVIEVLIQKIIEASDMYQDRVFAPEEEQKYEQIRLRAAQRKDILSAQGQRVYMICQMPFVEARDEVDYKVHLLVLSQGICNRNVTVETFK